MPFVLLPLFSGRLRACEVGFGGEEEEPGCYPHGMYTLPDHYPSSSLSEYCCYQIQRRLIVQESPSRLK